MDLDRVHAHKDKAAQLAQKGKHAQAAEELQRALELQPQDLVARRRLAEAYARMERIQDAISHYEKLAGRYASDGQLLEAVAIGKVILKLDPQHQRTQRALAQFAARREEAEAWKARIPLEMAGLIDESRFIDPTPPPDATVAFEVQGGPSTDLLGELPREVMVELLERLELRSFSPGEAIVREGETGQSMWVLAVGKVQVVQQFEGVPRTVDTMSDGAIFGEIALLSDVPRVASVVAETACMLLEVPRSLIASLSSRETLEPVLQRFYKERLLANLLRSAEVFRALPADSLKRLADRFELRTAERGDELIRQGDAGRGLWVLLRGRCVPYDVPTGEEYPEMREGSVFGEIALLEKCASTATVRAEARSVLLFLDREAFLAEVPRSPAASLRLEALAQERLRRSAEVLEPFGEVLPPSLI